jgi:hypothetical protein
MKCPRCELVIPDDRLKAHKERCHPELLFNQWETTGFMLASELEKLESKYKSLNVLLIECATIGSLSVHIYVLSEEKRQAAQMKHRVIVEIIPTPPGKVFKAHGVTPVAALALAMDRMEYADEMPML